ncbi:MAG: exodeoxyribonuclease V subunit gamma [Gammaproteobacteria bacterium]|jgi:exodeoxyribonuclease V gamma subunit|nr:exodeoxyribonuclease V subunit gamma [Gammaproteobacteria bacterium]
METGGEGVNGWPTGFMLIQGNRLEALCELLTSWMRAHPLHPLENEVIVVQSNGIGQWLKMALAEHPVPADTDGGPDGGGCGIAAAIDLMLPGRFLWKAYRAVLGALPDSSAYDKAPLGWRLFRLLGELDALAGTSDEQAQLAPLRGFLDADGDARRRHQLAARLADLFDQYQVYRADWLSAWERGEDILIRPNGARVEVPAAQRWQPLLWRRLRQDLAQALAQGLAQPTAASTEAPAPTPELSRAAIHAQFLEQARGLDPAHRPRGLPRRVIVFGLSSLPRQSIEVLEAVARVSQVMLFVHNPSRHYWGDIVEGRELFRRTYRRIQARDKVPDGLDESALHLHGHPLLAAWGKQGRDYIRLLDEHDERSQYEAHFERNGLAIDLFESPGEASLLQQIQDDILELRPLAERRARGTTIDPTRDRSLAFLIAHGPQREVEILHDQLLDAFAAAEADGAPLHPRDILVMVPDIATYAPHIEAVFGRLPADDPRYIPFHITDQSQRARNPLLIGLETLLQLPQARVSISELLDLLDIPALRARFGLAEADLPRLRQWVIGANIRWGLDADQRAGLGLPEGLEQNSWQFGLRRMLLGFAAGDSGPWAGIEPYDEVGGLEAALVGPLSRLLATLKAHWSALSTPRRPAEWTELIATLLDDCFQATGDADELALNRLHDALEQWLQDCEHGAALEEAIPLEVVRESLLAGLDEPTLSQRFLAGAVNFATLMPMRAIPFRQIWLLGMNDGDYPRRRRPADFDLMADDYRPGDRSRREDDRYLFLEALLSARERLVISWVGRSIRDDSPRPPSVLVGQLRDQIAAGWRLARRVDEPRGTGARNPETPAEGDDERSGLALLKALTTTHPLQPFSRRYFEPERDRLPDRTQDTEHGQERDPRQKPRQNPVHNPEHDTADNGAELFTYAYEWQALHRPSATPREQAPPQLAAPVFDAPLTLTALGRFLRRPVHAFYSQRLAVMLGQDAEQPTESEPFQVDGLARWRLHDRAIQAITQQLAAVPETATEVCLESAIGGLARSGALPLPPFDADWREELTIALRNPLERYRALLADHPRGLPAYTLTLQADGIALEDSLSGLRADAEGNRLLLVLQASALLDAKDHEPKWYHLVRHWPRHLAAQLAAPTTTRLLGPGGDVTLPPMMRDDAEAILDALLTGVVAGLSSPLPLACKTGLAWLAAEGGTGKAKREYEGGYQHSGERDEHPGYARFWPDWAALSGDERFAAYSEQLYRPLYESGASAREA